VLLPYYYEGKIVGSTARKVREGKPKYLSDQHPFFVFNVDEQDPLNKYVFVVEGQFDAYAIGGVGLLTNEISQQQAHIVNQLGKEIIVIPDQDRAGLMLINQAIDYDWAVAFPNWDNDVKDVADAVLKYGKLFVIVDAIKTAQQGEIKISVARNNLETRLALHEER
jgi:DNA primase